MSFRGNNSYHKLSDSLFFKGQLVDLNILHISDPSRNSFFIKIFFFKIKTKIAFYIHYIRFLLMSAMTVERSCFITRLLTLVVNWHIKDDTCTSRFKIYMISMKLK